jgi:hypothetical protein
MFSLFLKLCCSVSGCVWLQAFSIGCIEFQSLRSSACCATLSKASHDRPKQEVKATAVVFKASCSWYICQALRIDLCSTILSVVRPLLPCGTSLVAVTAQLRQRRQHVLRASPGHHPCLALLSTACCHCDSWISDWFGFEVAVVVEDLLSACRLHVVLASSPSCRPSLFQRKRPHLDNSSCCVSTE